ncbi:MAG: phosphate ABC transporter ATP-binding protein [Thermoplasmata archaeon]|nr:phosphate ABC transporter ATP-binding protein [Thermoplasmata archaeon]
MLIEGVRKRFGKKEVLRGVNLTVERGEVLSLVGPSGSGKSTLLKCINRLLEIDSGRIVVGGRDIREVNPVELRREVVLVPQNSVMFPGSVLENVMMPLLAQGINDEERAIKALKDAELTEEFLKMNAEKLSGGEKKRVALARAIALEPKALLLDEPTAGVDPKRVRAIEETILKMVKGRGITVIWVTHDTSQALRVGDRIASIKKGKVLKVGRRDEFQWEGVY